MDIDFLIVSIFSERLKGSMKEKRLSVNDLALLTDIKPITIRQYLSRSSYPRTPYLRALANVLEVDEHWLAGKDLENDSNYYRMKSFLSIKEAAQIMGKSEQFVRLCLQNGIYKFGVAEKMPGSNTYTYYISPKKFFEEIGDVNYM